MPRRRRLWSFSAGAKGSTVTVYERVPGGPLYARAFDPSLAHGRGGYRRVSLGHANKEMAETYALDQAAKLHAGRTELVTGNATLVRLFSEYLAHRTPRKTLGEQQEDRRRVRMWTRYFGNHRVPVTVSLADWERFIDLRSSGMIAADGQAVPEEGRRPVRARTVEADLKWLRWALNWATRWRDRGGRYLLRENPVRGFEIPTEKNPLRPLASDDRFEALRAVSDLVMTEIRWGAGRPVRRRSYLSELLDLAHDTGRRITAICALRYQDLRLEQAPRAPQGAIRWPGETDKEGREWVAPISHRARAALDRVFRERPGIGAAYLFPCPTDPSRPVQYERVRHWLLEAEKLAKLPKQRGASFHAYRRAWATARKHLPVTDVAAAGGWKSTVTIQRCYQQPDDGTMLSVVLGGVELREKNA